MYRLAFGTTQVPGDRSCYSTHLALCHSPGSLKKERLQGGVIMGGQVGKPGQDSGAKEPDIKDKTRNKKLNILRLIY